MKKPFKLLKSATIKTVDLAEVVSVKSKLMSNQFFGLDVSTEKSESEVDKRGIRRAYDQVSEDSYYINAAPDRIDSLPVRAFGIGPPLEEGEIDSTLNDDARREKFLGDLRARGTLEGAFKKQRTTDGVSPPPAVPEPAAPTTTQPPTKLTRLQKELLPRNKPGKKEAPLANERAFRRAKRTRKEKLIKLAQETFGSWGPSGLELLKEIGTRTIIASGNKRARANLFQNISMAMIRGNIINVKSTLPPLNKNQEFLFLN